MKPGGDSIVSFMTGVSCRPDNRHDESLYYEGASITIAGPSISIHLGFGKQYANAIVPYEYVRAVKVSRLDIVKGTFERYGPFALLLECEHQAWR